MCFRSVRWRLAVWARAALGRHVLAPRPTPWWRCSSGAVTAAISWPRERWRKSSSPNSHRASATHKWYSVTEQADHSLRLLLGLETKWTVIFNLLKLTDPRWCHFHLYTPVQLIIRTPEEMFLFSLLFLIVSLWGYKKLLLNIFQEHCVVKWCFFDLWEGIRMF